MSKQQITISDAIVRNVVRPVSLFLNDVPVGCVFSHRDMAEGEVHELDVENKKYPTYSYNSVESGTIKFTNFDLFRFRNKEGKDFATYFVERREQAYIATTFKVVKCEPYLDVKGKKVYAGIFHTGYESFKAKQDLGRVGNENFRMSDADFVTLYATPIVKGKEDKFYRTIQIDCDIFYYGEEEVSIKKPAKKDK